VAVVMVDLSAVKIYVRPGRTDLRKATNGLAALIQEEMGQDPLGGSVFLFCNRSRKLLKAVWWDKTDFWLSQKRLEQDRFPWPEYEQAAEELRMLLAGIDFWKAHKPLLYSKVS
jgi:transposase